MRLASCVLALTLASVAVVAATTTPASAALQLNEILAGPARDWDGSGTVSTRDDEWVEVINTGGGSITLDGYLITDGDSIPRYGLSGTLAAGEHLMITGKTSLDWERLVGQPAFGLSLANTGDSVILWQIVGPDTVVVDRYTYKSHEAAADRSVGRSPDGSGAWVLFDNLNPYTGSTLPVGTNCPPTPGAANGCDVTPARKTTWGEVKHIYR
jgi:hypothetical protein